jgi:23S rRNA pseudouridine2604 synthase
VSNQADKSLNKYISETGTCSRREADRLIDEGRVTINGKTAQKGNRVLPTDDVRINGKALIAKPETVYIAFHKPRGITCTTDRKDPTNIIDYIKFPERIFPIGRLDKDSDGLIFLTNDGDIVNKVLRAGNQHEKEYIVTVDKPITDDFIQKMARGVPILDTVTQPCLIRQEDVREFRIILTQGLNRQIRRMAEVLGYEVRTLTRVRIMHVWLDYIRVGAWRFFTQKEIDEMNRNVANSVKN